MPKYQYEDFLIAGPNRNGSFPPSINTFDEPTELEPWESPDSYGVDLSVTDKLGKSTIPAGTTRVQKTVTLGTAVGESVASVPFLWHYNRLWNITARTASTASNLLQVGASRYDARFLKQGPMLPFVEDSQTIVALVPFGNDQMAVLKSTGSYVISNCSDSRGTNVFSHTDLIQELACSALARTSELDGALYVSNATGLIAYVGGRTVEITKKVRDGLTNFINLALTVDYQKHRIIAKDSAGTSGFVYDVETEKLFRFATSTFRFTTRTFHMPDYETFAADRLIFVVEHASASTGTLTYQTKYEDESWGDTKTVTLTRSDEGASTVVGETLEDRREARRLQVRLNSLSSGKYIRQIRVEATGRGFDSTSL